MKGSFLFLRWALLAVALFALIGPAFAAKKSADAKPAALAVLHVPVDQGIQVKLDAPASSVFIANPDVADVQVMSPSSVMVFGKKTGQTTLFASDDTGRVLVNRTIMVAQNLDALRAVLRQSMPQSSIDVVSVPDGIVLTGEAKNATMAEDARKLALRFIPKDGGDVINRITVHGSNQIHIRVRFAEVSRDIDKRFGINWESIGDIAGVTFGIASGSGIIPTVPNSSLPYYPQGNIGSYRLQRVRPATNGSVNDITTFSKGGINGMIDALAQDGFITVLAEPNLTAMSGETASFLAGGEFPVPVPQSNNAIGVEWKTYGVSLAFTPTLVGDDRINLHVRPEVSEISDQGATEVNGINIPALTTRRAETTLELASGQSFAIGGLLNNKQSESVSKYPFLGDVPVLGQLFRSTRFLNNESELVIIITPYIVKPVGNDSVALPTDGFRPPNDKEFMVDYRLASPDTTRRAVSGAPIASTEPATPAAAPVETVSSAPAGQQPQPTPYKAPVAAYAPPPVAASHPTPSSAIPLAAPRGPGGFIVE